MNITPKKQAALKGAVDTALKLAKLYRRKAELMDDLALTCVLRGAYGIPLEGGVSHRVIDESSPRAARAGYAFGQHGKGRGRYTKIKGKVEIMHDGKVFATDDLLDFHYKTRGMFV